MKQAELARLAGVSRTYISQIETGAVDAIMTDVMVKLAKSLGVSVAYLLGLTDAPVGTADDGAPIDAGPDRLVFEVRDPELRALMVELADLMHGMTPAQRRYFADQARLMRRLMEEEESRAKNPIIIG
jgi:transcriptional regulator with XRE-family HTH domain